MNYYWILPFLFMFTLLAVRVFALVSKLAIEVRRHHPDVSKSTLSKDGPQGGVGFLLPPTSVGRVLRMCSRFWNSPCQNMGCAALPRWAR